MPYSVALAIILSLPAFTRAAIQSNATCQPNFEWSYNKGDLPPCFLLSAVSGPCYQQEFNTGPLPSDHHYDPPNSTIGTVNECSCSWAAYNLMMACTACQEKNTSILTWPTYRAECGDLISNTTYWPSDISIKSNYTIPFYAGHNPDDWENQQFNVQEAKSIADQNNPDLTVSPSPNDDTPTSSEKKATPVGVIVGGTVGGAALLVLGLFLTFYCCRRRRLSPEGLRPRDLAYAALSDSPSPSFTPNTTPRSTIYSRGPTMQSPPNSRSVTIYAALPQTLPERYPQHSRPVTPTPVMQIMARTPRPENHIEPYMLRCPGDSPGPLARKREEAPAGRGTPPSRVQSAPTSRAVTPERQGAHEQARRLRSVTEEEIQAVITRDRSGSQAQPPAYDTLTPSAEMDEIVAALRERNGNTHRSHEATRRNGSPDSQSSLISSRGAYRSVQSSESPVVEVA